MRKIETLANVSIILTALLFCAKLADEEWLHKPARELTPSGQVVSALRGARLQINGVNWDQAEKTLVMALSTQCHFCQESTPFYKELAASPSVRSKRVAIVTVFPQRQAEAESFVKASEIQANKVLSMPLQTIGTSSSQP
jgi:hypothetical protein